MEKWIQTDDMQWLKKIGPHHYELIEASEVDGKFLISAADEINVGAEEEYEDIINVYYSPDGINTFRELVTDVDTREQYLAEMIYECTSSLFADYGLLTYEQAMYVINTYIETGEYPETDDVERIKIE